MARNLHVGRAASATEKLHSQGGQADNVITEERIVG